MPATVLVGTQWGDEGKGKITDLIAGDFDCVCRYSGGANAGHTVIADNHTFGLHQIPSGIMYPDVLSVIGNGCLVDPGIVLEEMDSLGADGVSVKHLRISGNAHLIMPYHKDFDRLNEMRLGLNNIGTTGKGIGPCYQDKAARIGLRMQDMLDEDTFRARLENALALHNPILEHVYGLEPYSVDSICETYLGYADRLAPHIVESSHLLNELVEKGKKILFEGAQATMLDIDHGTYPFVTSSNCTAGGAVTGSGVSPRVIGRAIGVAKTYITRVGSGPLPTELPSGTEIGDQLTEIGQEYGVTTGRRRRVGWYDAVVMNHAVRVNGLTDLAFTKLDVLSFLKTIKVCVAYSVDGRRYTDVPDHAAAFAAAQPVYEELPGWQCDISDCRHFEDLPKEARAYITFLEKLAGVKAAFIAVGPDRKQTIACSRI